MRSAYLWSLQDQEMHVASTLWLPLPLGPTLPWVLLAFTLSINKILYRVILCLVSFTQLFHIHCVSVPCGTFCFSSLMFALGCFLVVMTVAAVNSLSYVAMYTWISAWCPGVWVPLAGWVTCSSWSSMSFSRCSWQFAACGDEWNPPCFRVLLTLSGPFCFLHS